MAFVHDRYNLIKNKTTGVDPLVDKILSGDPELVALYNQAKTLHLSDLKRSYVKACLVTGASIDESAALLEISTSVLEMYLDIFFNIRGFDRLSLLEVIGEIDNPEEKGMCIWALSQGIGFVAFRLGKASSISPVKGLEEMYQMAHWKAKEALFSNNNAEGSKNATIWVKLSMDLARLLKAWVLDSDAAKHDIELALKKVTPQFDGFAGINDDIDSPVN